MCPPSADGGSRDGRDERDGQDDRENPAGDGEGSDHGNGDGSRDSADDGGEEQPPGSADRPSTGEEVIMVVSVAFTVLLFAFAGWQMVTTPEETTPRASVVGTEQLGNGSVVVTVRLRNPADVGLISVTVSANCTSPPIDVTFTYVPASTDRTGTLVCPGGTDDPSVSIESWRQR